MAFRPAFTCCIAWFPVTAPSAQTYGSSCMRFHSFSAPSLASVYSTFTLPRSRTTSSAEKGRSIPSQRGLSRQSFTNSSTAFATMIPSLSGS